MCEFSTGGSLTAGGRYRSENTRVSVMMMISMVRGHSSRQNETLASTFLQNTYNVKVFQPNIHYINVSNRTISIIR